MQPEVILRIIARSAHHLINLAMFAGRHFDTSADGRSIRARPHALEHDPIVLVAALVAQQGGWPIQVVDDYVDIAIVVEVPNGAAASQILESNGWSGFRGNVLEMTVPKIAIQNPRLLVGDVEFLVHDLRVDVAIGNEEVLPPIVIKIEEAYPKTQIFPIYSEAGLDAGIVKRSLPVISVQRRDLVGEIRASDVEPAIGIEIADGHAHA